ncbi:hypothetical protein N7465_005586 [Penicillium sp. CMV-2018d]|nr:hypothetical protein N7465_005586 [Penicillium sp. CMV-2018d]
MSDHSSQIDFPRTSNEFLMDPRFYKQKGSKKRWSFLKSSIVFLGLIIGIIELVVLGLFFVQISWQYRQPPLLGELNNLVPEFPVHQVLFRQDPSATIDHQNEDSRNATRDNWLSYIPRGNGFINVNDSERYTLPDPIPFKENHAYSIAVFHQLHCLYAIMDVYNQLSSPASELPRDSTHEHNYHSHQHSHNHVDHCFRYLRQSLLCCGDTALEGQDPNTDTQGTDGTGAVHMCKDYDAIRDWAERNRIVDTKHN